MKKKLARDLHLLKRELLILRNLDHPNICKFYESYQDDQFFHFVMEYCSGGDLLERLMAEKHLSESSARKIMKKAFLAIAHLHEKGIVHRDIKPENFLFSSKKEDAELKLIDFGLSRKFDAANLPLTTVVGTPLYVSPEVIKGSYDQHCDYWSLGVLMYVLLSGQPPFDDETSSGVFKKVLAGKYTMKGEVWSTVSKNAKDLISKLLVIDPAKRYTAQQALAHPWMAEEQSSSPVEDQNNARDAINHLKAFNMKKKFRKEAMIVFVNLLKEDELKKLREAFTFCDKDASGEITLNELSQTMKELGFKDSEEEIVNLAKRIRISDSETIKYSEFLAAAMDSKNYLKQEKLWLGFKYFDIENTGYITLENIREVLAREGRKMTDEEINEMIREVDLSEDGKINFEEFCEMMGVHSPEEKRLKTREKDDVIAPSMTLTTFQTTVGAI